MRQFRINGYKGYKIDNREEYGFQNKKKSLWQRLKCCITVPTGYQDEKGFHYGEK
jgi:hypothetical protein